MQLLATEKFSRDALAKLTELERNTRLRELEAIANRTLQACPTLTAFQTELYQLIDRLKDLGNVLYSWDYDCEIEYWGGDYTKENVEYELLLRSEFPMGISLAWKDPEALR